MPIRGPRGLAKLLWLRSSSPSTARGKDNSRWSARFDHRGLSGGFYIGCKEICFFPFPPYPLVHPAAFPVKLTKIVTLKLPRSEPRLQNRQLIGGTRLAIEVLRGFHNYGSHQAFRTKCRVVRSVRCVCFLRARISSCNYSQKGEAAK